MPEQYMSDETIMVISGHADDPSVGLGSTIAKYASEGKKVITIVFSYGERSIPYMKREIVIDKVVKESKAADKLLGGSGVIFLGLRSGHFTEDFKNQKTEETLKKIILKYNPSKIFTHSSEDPHPEHKNVNRLVLETYDRLSYKKKFEADIYSFGVWRLFRVEKRKRPRLVVDVSSTFNKKLKAINLFKSQRARLFPLRIGTYLHALHRGLKYNTQFVEEFQKLR